MFRERSPVAGLTERAVSAARARASEVFLWDGQLPGFGVRIKPASLKNPDGVKTFFLQYRVGPQTRRIKIGRHPALRVENARKIAVDLLGQVNAGGDPSGQRRNERASQADTVEAIAGLFIEKYAKAKGRRGWRETERIFRVYVVPTLGKRPIRTVKRRDIIDLLDAVAENNGPIMANRVLAAVRKLFNWAIARDILDASPVVGIEKPGEETSRDRVLSDAEIRRVWNAAETLGYPYGHFAKALLLTGQRRSEVAAMRWQEVNDSEQVWTVPPERTKNKLAHEVPLARPLADLLVSIPRSGDYVFKTGRTGDKPLNSFTLAKQRFDAATSNLGQEATKGRRNASDEVPSLPHWTLHDLRRTVRTRLSKLGVQPEIAERVIGHVPTGIRAVYDLHQFREEKRAALAIWAQSLANIIDPSDKVVALPVAQRRGGRPRQEAATEGAHEEAAS
jgi:integrase